MEAWRKNVEEWYQNKYILEELFEIELRWNVN
jgi:hypothetical protein